MFSLKQRTFLKLPKEQALHLQGITLKSSLDACLYRQPRASFVVESDCLAKAIRSQHEVI